MSLPPPVWCRLLEYGPAFDPRSGVKGLLPGCFAADLDGRQVLITSSHDEDTMVAVGETLELVDHRAGLDGRVQFADPAVLPEALDAIRRVGRPDPSGRSPLSPDFVCGPDGVVEGWVLDARLRFVAVVPAGHLPGTGMLSTDDLQEVGAC